MILLSGNSAHATFGAKKTRILYLITILVLVVFIAFGLASWLVFRGSQDRLVQKSKDKLIQTEVDNITSASGYIGEILTAAFTTAMGNLSVTEISDAFTNKKISAAQEEVDAELRRMKENGVLGLEEVLVVLLPTALNPEPMVILSSDESLVYEWEMPDYLLQAVEDGEPYLWMENGVPELSLSGEYLLVLQTTVAPDTGTEYVNIMAKPMSEEVSDIDDFFASEQKNTNLVLAIVILGSVFVVFIITFFVLSYLIRKRITRPIEELAAAAGEVMEGNLDVDIQVHEGGEFEDLERAFKEMVESFRRYIAKSVGEE